MVTMIMLAGLAIRVPSPDCAMEVTAEAPRDIINAKVCTAYNVTQ